MDEAAYSKNCLMPVRGLGSSSEIWEQSVTAKLCGRSVGTLSLPDLIKAKRATGRVKDLRVLPELESILEALKP